jgi:hypothetical protein
MNRADELVLCACKAVSGTEFPASPGTTSGDAGHNTPRDSRETG